MKLELIATSTFGLEAPVKRELEALGFKILKSEDGKITFQGDERGVVGALGAIAADGRPPNAAAD